MKKEEEEKEELAKDTHPVSLSSSIKELRDWGVRREREREEERGFFYIEGRHRF